MSYTAMSYETLNNLLSALNPTSSSPALVSSNEVLRSFESRRASLNTCNLNQPCNTTICNVLKYGIPLTVKPPALVQIPSAGTGDDTIL